MAELVPWEDQPWAEGLLVILRRAQNLGFVGPGPVDDHIEQADRFATAVGADLPARALDLGSGAGVPGLVLALRWEGSHWTLLDSMVRRTGPLEEAVAELGLENRVTVVCARAELAAHDPARRGQFDLVVARSFGAPAVVVECGAPFLEVGGRLVVTDPPDGPGERWPVAELAPLGLIVDHHRAGCTALRLEGPFPAALPRRVGVPTKRPLFS